MNEVKERISIERDEYAKLVREKEKIEAVRRLVTRLNYVSVDEILAALDIYFQREA